MTDTFTSTHTASSSTRLRSLSRRVYPLRTLGVGLSTLPVAVALHELDAGWASWTWIGFCLLWPHLAWWMAQHSADPYRTERRSLLVDSALAGIAAPLIHFNLLPSIVLMTVATGDKISSGVRGLWLPSLPVMGAGLLLGGLATGFAWQPVTSMPVLLASLPILVIHTLAVAFNNYTLVRKVQKQNLALDELSRRDHLTGLYSRRHWQAQAENALLLHQASAMPMTLILIDADHFKTVNDRYGHATGDDVLRSLADAIRRHLPEGSHAGRVGGDEFAVVVPLAMDAATHVAERIRADVDAQHFPRLPNLRCSISLGLAEPPQPGLGLREWSEVADQAMYRAKESGRNRIVWPEADAV
ncbi:MAG: diguanylate cyclase [Lysobacteraceae bacterium]